MTLNLTGAVSWHARKQETTETEMKGELNAGTEVKLRNVRELSCDCLFLGFLRGNCGRIV